MVYRMSNQQKGHIDISKPSSEYAYKIISAPSGFVRAHTSAGKSSHNPILQGSLPVRNGRKINPFNQNIKHFQFRKNI